MDAIENLFVYKYASRSLKVHAARNPDEMQLLCGQRVDRDCLEWTPDLVTCKRCLSARVKKGDS